VHEQVSLRLSHHWRTKDRVGPVYRYLTSADVDRHLKSNAQALDIHLSREQVRFLDNVLPFDYGQPMSQVGESLTDHEELRSLR
jgi:hypothetical protein